MLSAADATTVTITDDVADVDDDDDDAVVVDVVHRMNEHNWPILYEMNGMK